MKFFDELKRRNVIKETLAYLVVSWVLLQVVSTVLPIFDAPDWVLKTVIFILALGLPFWVFFSWTYQVTSEGFKRTSENLEEPSVIVATNKRLNVIIIITLVIAIAISLVDLKSNHGNEEKADSDLAINNSIAVLPFLDMSPNKDQEYLSDGIAEDILNRLCKFKELSVAAVTSSFSFKNKNEDIKTIGKKLNVNNILEGSVRKNETDIIITVRLTNAENGFTLLSESYTDDLQNIVGLQSTIALDIAERIESKLSNTGKQLVQSKKIKPMAFESYLKGRSQFLNGPLNMLPGEIFTAKKYFEAAIDQDSTFAEAHAYLALAYFNLADWALPRIEKSKIASALDSAQFLSKRALLLDSLNSGAHLAMGSYYFHQFNWIAAEKSKRKAVELNPGGSEEKFILASFLGQFGQAEEALRLDKEAMRLDPLDVRSKIKFIRDLYRARKYDEGIRMCHMVLTEKPNSSAEYQFLGFFYSAKKQYKEAAQALVKQFELVGNKKGAAYFKNSDSRAGFQKMIQDINDSTPLELRSPMWMSWAYAGLEDKDNTLKYLDIMVNNRLPQISMVSQPYYDFLRDDPRYLELYEKAGFKEYDEYKLKQGVNLK